MVSKESQISHRLILTKDGYRNKEFDETVIKLIRKIQLNHLVSEEMIKKTIDDIDSYVFSLPGVDEKASLVKYEFPIYFVGEYFSKEQGIAWNRVKKEFQKELGKDYLLYNRVSYDLKEKELNKIPKILKKISYFRKMPPNELYITLVINAETTKHDKVLGIAKEIDEYVDRARIPFVPTRFDELKIDFEESKLDVINDLKENIPAFKSLQEMIKTDKESDKFDYTTPEEVVEYMMHFGFFSSAYSKEMCGIPIPDFIRGWNELFANLDLLQREKYIDGTVLRISFDASITNESNLISLWSCSVRPSPEVLAIL